MTGHGMAAMETNQAGVTLCILKQYIPVMSAEEKSYP